MNLPFKPRGPLVPLSLLLVVVVAAVGVTAPLAAAVPAGAGLQRREARAVERAARHAKRVQEGEARRAARAEERAVRRNDRRPTGGASEEAPETSGEAGPGMPSLGSSDRGCHVSIAVSSPRILAEETVTVTGAVRCPTAVSAAGQHVTLFQRTAGGHGNVASTNIDTLTAAADGTFAVTSAALDTNTVFQAREGRHGAHALVKVAPRITLVLLAPAGAASATVGSDGPARAEASFTGTVTPATPGAVVALQVAYAASGGRWRSVAWTRLAADGSYSIVHGFRNPGATSVRAIVHSGRHHAVGASEALPYEPALPQNPQLTIQSSADPLLAGQAVTISGIAAAAEGAPVKLLASTAGSSFATLAEATTDASGKYVFTEAPVANTLYRVSDASTRSGTLLETVALALGTNAVPSSLKAGQAVNFAGTVTPVASGHTVLIEQRYASGIGFHVIATGTVQAAPDYSVAHIFAKPGRYVLRVGVPGEGRNETTASAPFELTVEA